MAPKASPLSHQARLLLVVHSIILLARVGAQVFVNAYVLRISGSIAVVALYNVTFYCVATIVFMLSGPRCSRGGGLSVYRMGFAVYTLFFLTMSVLQDNARDWIAPLAVLYGIATGLYWLPFNLFKIGFNRQPVRLSFFSYEETLDRVVGIVVPALLGLLIWRTNTYLGVFLALTILFGMAFWITLRLSATPFVQREAYGLREFVRVARECADATAVYRGVFFSGLSIYGALDTFVLLLVFLATGSELELGLMASLLPLIGVVTSLASRRLKSAAYGKAILLAALVSFIATLLLVSHLTIETIIIYATINAACMPILSILQFVFSFNIVDENKWLASHTAEHMVLRELYMNAGRSVSFLLLFGLANAPAALWSTSTGIRLALVVLGASLVVMAWFIRSPQITA